jgi:hypothetical protein
MSKQYRCLAAPEQYYHSLTDSYNHTYINSTCGGSSQPLQRLQLHMQLRLKLLHLQLLIRLQLQLQLNHITNASPIAVAYITTYLVVHTYYGWAM